MNRIRGSMLVTLLACAALPLGVSLSGCSGVSALQPDVTAIVTQVISACQAACGVLPAAADVENLIPIYGPDAVAIETAICSAVQVAEASPRAKLRANGKPSQVVVHGVVVHFQ